MPFSHHSHSGQFCEGHAVDSLEECIEAGICKGLRVFGVTEHMPRHEIDFYPEEKGSGASLQSHFDNEKAYFETATKLRAKYKDRIGIPVGFESDWIRPESKELIERSIKSYSFDYFIGSVHHVHATPIDYDHDMYYAAREKAGGTDQELFKDYFDAQYDMLQAVRPPVVGHFDLIRLKSNDPDVSGGWQEMEEIWSKALRNLDFVASYGGMLEVNTAALRKGMAELYPKKEIIQAALQRGIRFCLSDDSHGVVQIAYGYPEALEFLSECGVQELHYIRRNDGLQSSVDNRFPCLEICKARIEAIRSGPNGELINA